MKVGLLTSGGDSPGMNAAVRAIVRVGIHRGLEVEGIKGGYQGLLDEEFVPLNARSVANIIQRGGTILNTGRSEEFKTEQGQKKAAKILDERGISVLIAIGGDGTMRGLFELRKHWDRRVIGLPGTIDNDLYGTDFTIGFDTAVNNAIRAVDKIRDTIEAYARVFLVEVMGRHSGEIALHVGIASGAEAILMPETKTDLEKIASDIIKGRKRGKKSAIMIVAEGDEAGDASSIAKRLSDLVGETCRVSVLGYIQRGGNPTRQDRLLATRLGAYAIECLLSGKDQVMVGEIGGKPSATPLVDTWEKKKPVDEWMIGLVDDLST